MLGIQTEAQAQCSSSHLTSHSTRVDVASAMGGAVGGREAWLDLVHKHSKAIKGTLLFVLP